MWIPRRRFIGHGLKDLVDKFLPEDQVDDFAAWAFDEDYNNLKVEEFAHAWNQRHKDLYEVNIANTIVHDVAKMTTYYKNRIKDE
jgi:hypothetical protein